MAVRHKSERFRLLVDKLLGHSLNRRGRQKVDTYVIPCPLTEDTRFSFVSVFREATEYCQLYTRPYNMLGICIRENEADPSHTEIVGRDERFVHHCDDISLVTCDTPLRVRFTPANVHLAIHFRLELFPGLDVFSGLKQCFYRNDPELSREGQMIFAEKDPVLMLAKCREFALRICLQYWPKQYPFNRNRIQPFLPVLAFIRGHVDAAVEIRELAAMIGWSEGYFTRSFHEIFRQTPKQYLQHELFSRAAQLLLNPEMTVKTTAAELKFSSEFYFSRFFKRLSGVSPAEYRKSAVPVAGGQKRT